MDHVCTGHAGDGLDSIFSHCILELGTHTAKRLFLAKRLAMLLELFGTENTII
jgi:hypothetical protein